MTRVDEGKGSEGAPQDSLVFSGGDHGVTFLVTPLQFSSPSAAWKFFVVRWLTVAVGS